MANRRASILRTVFARAMQALAMTPVITALFLGALVLAASVPNAPIVKHLAEDRALFAVERAYAATGRKIDVGTECLGVSFGLAKANEEIDALARAIRAPVYLSCASLVAHLESTDTAGDLQSDYARYWHGYAAISRPMLALLPYHDFRMLYFNGVLALAFALGFRLYRDFGLKFAVAVFLPFYFINYAGFLLLWTKAVTWIVALCAALYFANARRPYERDPFLAFFVIGAFTAYLDWLTTPLFTFAFPAYIYFFYLYRRGGAPAPREAVVRLLLMGAFWASGYALLLLAKFILATAVLGEGYWTDIIGSGLMRFRGAYESVKPWPGAAILENFEALKGFWGPLALIVFIALPLARQSGRRAARELFTRTPVFALLAASPFVWYEILTNHSQIHATFTHANLVLFLLPLSLVLFGESARFTGAGARSPGEGKKQ
ncbi:MAG: hypothetical protein WD076_06350 [Parvularculaceae bacterium]